MHIDGQRLIRGMRNEHFTLKPFDRRQFHFNVPVLYRGKYKVGISHIEVRDFLNMFSLKYYPDEPKLIRVFPRILSVEQVDLPYVRISENEYLSQNKNAGNTEIENIREYMYGDSLKKIHWKLSSKFNKWIAKDTNAACEKEFWILLNLEKIDGDMDYALKIEDRKRQCNKKKGIWKKTAIKIYVNQCQKEYYQIPCSVPLHNASSVNNLPDLL
jgi:hypothetical protein